jgi:hypothetical protein
MPQYYFNVSDGQTVLDQDGQEMADLAAARQEAMAAAGQMLSEHRPAWDGAKWEMWVTDEPDGRGKTLLSLVFAATDKS